MFSSFWILCNNSWMQVPLGHAVVDGKFIPDDWKAILLGPVSRVRWPHMLLGAFLTTGHVRRGHRRLASPAPLRRERPMSCWTGASASPPC